MKKQIFLNAALLLTFYACESADIGKRLPQETVELSPDAGESVDLGLSVMWADRSLDGYYAWGEIESKIRFSEDNYEAPFEITASSVNNISGSKYDAARMNWVENGACRPIRNTWNLSRNVHLSGRVGV